MLKGSLTTSDTALLVIDVQEKLIRLVDRASDVLHAIQRVIKGFQILEMPIVVTEQYPEGLGATVPALKSYLGDNQAYLTKTAFSCLADPLIKKEIASFSQTNWVIIGLEAHVCVLQSAKDLVLSGKNVIILNDAITSRSIYDYSTAIAEMRDSGIRITSSETILFELLKSSKSPHFKAISQLIK